MAHQKTSNWQYNLECVARLDKIAMVERIQELAGLSQEQADQAVDAVSLAMSTWLEAMLSTIPPNTRAELSFPNVGILRVTWKAPGKIPWRVVCKIPQRPPVLIIEFVPARHLRPIMWKTNGPIRRDHRKIYKEALAEYRRLHPKTRWVAVDDNENFPAL